MNIWEQGLAISLYKLDMGDTRNIVTSTPLPQSTSGNKFPPNNEEKIPKMRLDAVKQPMLEMVREAIEILGVPKKGASYMAIRNYIKNKKGESGGLTLRIRKAVIKGIDNGILERPKGSKDVKGLAGYFMLHNLEKKAKVAHAKPKEPKVRKRVHKEQVSDSETVVKKPKIKEKPNLSDSAIPESKETKAKSKLAKAKIEKPLAKPTKPKIKPVKTNSKLPKVPDKNSEAKTTKPVVKKKKPVKKNVTEGELETRKDASDSEFVVKKPNRKSLKSYSSDTEIDRATKTNTIKPKVTTQKKQTKATRNEVKESDPPAKLKGRKLFKVDEQNPLEKTSTTAKTGRGRPKKTDLKYI